MTHQCAPIKLREWELREDCVVACGRDLAIGAKTHENGAKAPGNPPSSVASRARCVVGAMNGLIEHPARPPRRTTTRVPREAYFSEENRGFWTSRSFASLRTRRSPADDASSPIRDFHPRKRTETHPAPALPSVAHRSSPHARRPRCTLLKIRTRPSVGGSSEAEGGMIASSKKISPQRHEASTMRIARR